MRKNILNRAIRIASTYRVGEGEGDTFSKEDVATAVAAAVAAANDKSATANNSARAELNADLKKAKDIAKSFEGIDLEKMKTMASAFENDQDMQDVTNGKFKDVIARHTEKIVAEFQSRQNSDAELITDFKSNNEKLSTKVSKLLIDNNVVSEFVKEKGTETAIDDVTSRANQIFKVEGDDLIPRGPDGQILLGKNGTLTIPEWIGGLKTTAPHLFPGSNDGKPGGGQGGQGGNALSDRIAASVNDPKAYQALRRQQMKEQRDA